MDVASRQFINCRLIFWLMDYESASCEGKNDLYVLIKEEFESFIRK